MTNVVFLITLASGIAIFLSLLVSLAWPQRRIWPPPGRRSWQFAATWTFYTINIGGAILLGLLDWDSYTFSNWIRYPIGLLFIVGGLGLAFWGIRTLGWHRTSGLKDSVARGGPYEFTRNPQYVGDALALLGYAILVNSSLVWVVNLLGILCFRITPFTEEPWLADQYGQAYRDYKQEIPRYL